MSMIDTRKKLSGDKPQTAAGFDPQPKRRARPNLFRAGERNGEQYDVNDSVKNVRCIIHQLKCFLNSSADLAGDGDR